VTDTPPLADEEDPVAVAAERETLEVFPEYHRGPLSGKLRGVFQHYLGGKPREEITGNARGDAFREQIDGATGD
jgi:hypothetical protein